MTTNGHVLITAVTLLALGATAALSQEQRPRGPNEGYKAAEGYYGNSMVFHDKTGKMTAFIYYNSDGSMQEWRMGRWTKGSFLVNNGQDSTIICQTRRQDEKPLSNCHPFAPNVKVGDRWTIDEIAGGHGGPKGLKVFAAGETPPSDEAWNELVSGHIAAPDGTSVADAK